MAKQSRQVMQFKITLLEIEPPVWRRIQVPDTYSFWDLHVAIQDAMGWRDCHLHQFSLTDPATGASLAIGIPEEFEPDDIEAGWSYRIADYFIKPGDSALYQYDFGDDWRHSVVLEDILPAEKGVRYPTCLDGARKCPPEDCGGPWGYLEFLQAIRDPHHEEHESLLQWVGEPFDPEAFDAKRVRFSNPKKRLELFL
jgi:hypothetical protein